MFAESNILEYKHSFHISTYERDEHIINDINDKCSTVYITSRHLVSVALLTNMSHFPVTQLTRATGGL